MPLEDDIVQDILKRVVKHLQSSSGGTFSEQMAFQVMEIEPQIRRDWGGARPFIAKRGPLLVRVREKVRAQVGTKPDDEIARENGISRRTMYRYLAKDGGK